MPTNKSRRIKYSATFPTGDVVTRASERTYTHAWLVVYTRNAAGKERARKLGWNEAKLGDLRASNGFSNGKLLAEKALKQGLPDLAFYDIKYQGIVEVTHG